MSNALDDLRHKLADVICSDRAVDNWQATPSDYDLADAIIAALPGLVKSLEWGEVQWEPDEFGSPAWGEFTDNLTSMSKCECYAIYRFEAGKFMWTQGDHDNMRFSTYRPIFDRDWVPGIPWHPTEESAQSAANAHYTAQIMAAFGIDGEST